MRSRIVTVFTCALIFLSIDSFCQKPSSHEEMILLLKQSDRNAFKSNNQWSPPAKIAYLDSLVKAGLTPDEIKTNLYWKGKFLLELGEEDQAIQIFEEFIKEDTNYDLEPIWMDLALAYLRKGERANCIINHASESCILPVKGMGVYTDPVASRKAIDIYQHLLSKTKNHSHFESGWLLNLAYMTLGEYPKGVPPMFFIPGLEGDTTYKINAFQDIAADLKLDIKNMAGGSIVEDFDNDGYLDILTSAWGTDEAMHYFKNNADGTFSEIADKAGLKGITGGLNMMQTDYNNDGYKDVFVVRGGWKEEFGKEPNSLLKNNGDGTFVDVTTQSGLLSFHPTQTATWNDFNNDGWLDLFIGNESELQKKLHHPCELYMNNKDGTFREIATKAKCDILNYVKGVTSGDYDNDGWKDIFLSTMDGKRTLLKNKGIAGREIVFEDVTAQAGLDKEKGKTFPTWFWDYNNDGWLDIFVCDYSFDKSLAWFVAAEKLQFPFGTPEKIILYRNNHDGTFTNVANEIGLNKNAFAMGSNFGDIDNDGFLDIYLGTGNPDYKSLVPNKMFKNIGGQKFADVTTSARVGHLQKGHGVSFADMDNDGDQDIYIEMGGAYPGDAYQNSFFLNPGQGNNHWICLHVEGKKSNRAAIGTKIKITLTENGVPRSIYRDVNSGGSFGSSPLRREIGLGKAEKIDEIEIRWHGSGEIQIFKDIKANQFVKIVEGSNKVKSINLKTLTWTKQERTHHHIH